MKRLKILLIFAFSLICFYLLSSCDFSQDVVVKEKNPQTPTIGVNGSIEDFATQFKTSESSNGNARTILPAAWTLADADDSLGTAAIGFWLYGKATNGEIYGPLRITPDANGNFSFEVGKYNWIFTLYACDQDDRNTLAKAEEAAVLKAHATVDLRINMMSPIFRLTSNEINRVGYADLLVSLDEWDMSSDFTARISLRNIITDEIIDFENGQSTARAGNILSSGLSSINKYSFGWGMGIAAGTYNFCVEFVNSVTGSVFRWSDKIVIVPGKTTENNNLKVPKVIDTPPAKPTNFAVSYDSSTADIVSGYYNAYFTWTDASTSEESFELVLTETSSGSPIETVFGLDVFSVGESYLSGSLSMNSTELGLKLELGKKYSARLRSKNGAGYSAYTDSLENINLYRVTYYVQGGKWYSDWNPATETGSTIEVANKVAYYKIADGTIVLWKYIDNGLSYDGDHLSGWYLGSISESNKIAPGSSYSSGKNIDLFAIYDGIEVTQEKLAALVFDGGWLEFNGVIPSIGGGGEPVSTISGVSTLHINVKVPEAVGTTLGITGFKFDSIEVKLINNSTGSKRTQIIEGIDVAPLGVSNPFTFSNLASGEYKAITTATYAGYAKTYTVNLTVSN